MVTNYFNLRCIIKAVVLIKCSRNGLAYIEIKRSNKHIFIYVVDLNELHMISRWWLTLLDVDR